MTEYIELYSKNEKEFYKKNINFHDNLQQLYELKPFVIVNPKIIDGYITIDNICESCILIYNIIYYDQCIFDKFIKSNYKYNILKIVCEGKVHFFYQIIDSEVNTPTHSFYFSPEYAFEYGFLSHFIHTENSNNTCFDEIKLIKKVEKEIPYSSNSLFINIYNNIDKFCLINQNQSLILIFEEDEIIEFKRIKSNSLYTDDTVKIVNTESGCKFKGEYSFAKIFSGNFISSLIIFGSIPICLKNINFSIFNILFFTILYSIHISTNLKVESSNMVIFLEKCNYFSPVKKYYEYTYTDSNNRIKCINELKYN